MREKERLGYAVSRYSDSVKRLKEAVEMDENPLSIDGTIQRFEFTFEQAWKTVQKFLRFEGVDCNSPRNCMKEAFSIGLVSDEELWLDMLDDRNMTSHIYDETQAKNIYSRIKTQYTVMLDNLLTEFYKRLEV
jgi:nucleotidyltransferase substrate binding protein (TIGR01987 family)